MGISNLAAMRDNNERLVLQALFNAKETSQAAIAKQLNLNKSTVSSICRTLKDQGFIEELGEGRVTEAGGRKPKLIRFNQKYGFVLVFDIGRYHLRVATIRLTGPMIAQEIIDVEDLNINEIIAIMQKQIDKNHVKDGYIHNMMGIMLSIHGVVFDNKVVTTPFLDYSQTDIQRVLAAYADVPVYLENVANLAAIFTRDYHPYDLDKEYNNLVTLNIHYGIGAGIIMNKQLYRGANGHAGEFGRSIIPLSGADIIHVEQLYSEDAILKRVNEQHPDKSFNTRKELFQLALDGDVLTKMILTDWTRGIASLIFNVAQQYAPEAVFIHSRFIAEMPSLLDDIVAHYHHLQPTATTKIIFASQSVYDATLLGGAAYLIHELFAFEELKMKISV